MDTKEQALEKALTRLRDVASQCDHFRAMLACDPGKVVAYEKEFPFEVAAPEPRNASRMAALEKALAVAREALEAGRTDWFQVSHDTTRGCYVVNGVEFRYETKRIPAVNTIVRWTTSDGTAKVGFVGAGELDSEGKLQVYVNTSTEKIYSYVSEWIEMREVP